MAAKGWVIDLFGIKSAFLYALLRDSDRVWIHLPSVPGFPEFTRLIVKLRKSHFGLRQAPKLWNELLAKSLKIVWFRRSIINDSLFIRTTHCPPVYLLVYVDDIHVFGNGAVVNEVKNYLSRLLLTTDLCNCTHLLGIKIERVKNGLFLIQKPFTQKNIDLAGRTNGKPINALLPSPSPLFPTL